MLIGITGPSGVGKTTVSKMLALILGHKETLILSGDDLHRWERGSSNWQMYTHLDPSANDISKGTEDLRSLLNGQPIQRKVYDHDIGCFTEGIKMMPHQHVIYEGLHSLYDEAARDLYDFSIYVETDLSLKKEWKLKRDTQDRGYTVEQVLDAMKNRIPDERKYILPQKKYANVVIEFSRKDDQVQLDYACNDVNKHFILDELVALYNKQSEFLDVAAKVHAKKTLAPNRGGNMSFRWNDVLSVTSSGVDFGDVELFSGYTRCDAHSLESVFSMDAPPSMEAPVHLKMGKNVLHTHPAHVLAVLCCREAPQILKSLIKESFVLLEYFSPGEELAKAVDNKNSIIFARNHGLFVSSEESLEDCYEITCSIEASCKEYFKESIDRNYLFPDAYVLEEENETLHAFVKNKINEAGLTPVSLSSKSILELENMEEEKYRKQI